MVALALVGVYATAFGPVARNRVARAGQRLSQHAAWLALAVTLLLTVVAVRYSTYVAGAADAYGYVSQADLWLSGSLRAEQPLASRVEWNDREWTFSPLGYRPATEGPRIVPTYAPGLPLLMALGKVIAGTCGVYLVVPLLAGLTVWATYLLGATTGGRGVGLAAAALMAASPAFVFMALTPMSDVPVTAFTTAALAMAVGTSPNRAVWTGLLMSGTLLIRPNLVPLAAVFGLYFLLAGPTLRARLASAAAFSLGTLPVIVFIALLHTHLYGSPLASGYGTLDGLYAWRFLGENLQRFPLWLFDTQTPLIAAAVLPPLAIAFKRREELDSTRVLLVFAFGAAVWLCYLFYIPFDEWWFLRFLLPAYPPMLVLAAMGWQRLVSRMTVPIRGLAFAGITAAVLSWQAERIQDHLILRMQEGEVLYVSAARYVEARLPSNAIFFAMLHGGSLRHYASRPTVRWDWLSPDWWPRALLQLQALGYQPYVLLAESEEAQFRTQFKLGDAPDAPGVIVGEMNGPSRVRVYDPLAIRNLPTAPPTETMPHVLPSPCGACFGLEGRGVRY